MNSGKCYIVDPVCAITYGHSLNSLKYFYDVAKNYYETVHVFVSKFLPEAESNIKLNRFFNFYYSDYIKIKEMPPIENEIDPAIFKSQNDLAAYDFDKFFDFISVSRHDTILLPSADHHSLMGLTNAMRRLSAERRPRLLLRFINVLENVNSPGPNILPDCIQRVLLCKKDGYDISLSAETPKYRRYLEDLTNTAINVAPYPASSLKSLPVPQDKYFTVLCGGSGREDKGFFRLANIIEHCNRRGGNINFIVQNLHDSHQFNNIEYINRLYSIPNVILLPGVISYGDILSSYEQSHISIMPYDPETYEYRGSAMLMESLLLGRQCIGQSGTGFSEQINLYACGSACGSNSEFAETIIAYSNLPKTELERRSDTARSLYIQDVNAQYDQWIKGDTK